MLKILVALFCAFGVSTAALAAVVMDSDNSATSNLGLPIYWWSSDGDPPRAIVIALHGFAEHGQSFNTLANALAEKRISVVAFDMRGCGRWRDRDWSLSSSQVIDGRNERKPPLRLDYQRTVSDVAAITKRVSELYPKLPIFLLGESMGADTAVTAAASVNVSVNGIILANPAIKFRPGVGLRSAPQFFLSLLPGAKIDLRHNLAYVVNDDQILKEKMSDPMLLHEVSKADGIQTLKFIRRTRKAARYVPATIPTLILVSDRDQLLASRGIYDLFTTIGSSDKSVRSIPDRSHILLETSYLPAAARDAVLKWIADHIL